VPTYDARVTLLIAREEADVIGATSEMLGKVAPIVGDPGNLKGGYSMIKNAIEVSKSPAATKGDKVKAWLSVAAGVGMMLLPVLTNDKPGPTA
jgi:hypothetical protein